MTNDNLIDVFNIPYCVVRYSIREKNGKVDIEISIFAHCCMLAWKKLVTCILVQLAFILPGFNRSIKETSHKAFKVIKRILFFFLRFCIESHTLTDKNDPKVGYLDS